MSASEIILKEIPIAAPAHLVWNALTIPRLMKQWMAEPEMKMEIITNWCVGEPVVIRGFHHIQFENKGIVLKFEPNSILKYSYLSSLSKLPDQPENYTVLEFRLKPLKENLTLVQLNIRGFPTETIYRHVDFYWTSTLILLKQTIEKNASFSVN